MRRITIPVTLVVSGPVLTKSSAADAAGLDAPIAKSKFLNPATRAVEQRYYLPGRLVKGLLREAWQEISALDNAYRERVATWLGVESPQDSDFSPQRGRFHWGDFADFRTPVNARKRRTRIRIDEVRGAADAQMLQVLESPYASGQEVRFSGEVRFLAQDGEDTSPPVDWLKRGLCWAMGAGANGTVGFGELLDVEVGAMKDVSPPAASCPGPVWDLRLKFQQPLLFAERRIAENLFESGEVIPGGALKGALGRMIEAAPGEVPELASELKRVVFTHAFPAAGGRPRPAQWPLSLLAFGKAKIVNAIGKQDAYADGEAAGAFDIDWKSETQKGVREKFGWAQPGYELRVRVSIDSSLRKAADQKLFAWKMLMPHGVVWNGRVDTSALSATARQQLERLLRFGLEPVGKTQALATVDLAESALTETAAGGTYVVTLQTPALLMDPSRRLAPANGIGSAKEGDLREELQEAWKELSGGSVEMGNYFQRCRLAGGEYFHRRFLGVERAYRPYLLTSEGSTFQLRATAGREQDAAACMERWSRRGLPLSARVREFYGVPDENDQTQEQWRRCPYLPENGYGEITVNATCPYPEA